MRVVVVVVVGGLLLLVGVSVSPQLLVLIDLIFVFHRLFFDAV